MQVDFVITNPGHHLAAARPLAIEIAARGHRVAFVSLCELRGYETPTAPLEADGFEVRRVMPLSVRRSPDVGWARRLARRPGLARWARRGVATAYLRPRLRTSLPASTDVAVLPNDAVFPFTAIVDRLRRRRTPFLLLQEGIRFPQPGVVARDAYGRGGAAAIAAWGESSAAYFRDVGAPADTIHVTGNPRLDAIDPASFTAEGKQLLERLQVGPRPLLYLSNPVETQGLCDEAEKLELFRRFVAAAVPHLRRRDRWLVAKLHPGESEAAFQAVVDGGGFERVVVTARAPLYPLLAAGGAAVVLASTVGIEATCFGLPLAVLEIPGHGFVFDYVDSGLARGLGQERLAEELAAFLDQPPDPEAARRYLDRALAGRAGSVERIAALIERLGDCARADPRGRRPPSA